MTKRYCTDNCDHGCGCNCVSCNSGGNASGGGALDSLSKGQLLKKIQELGFAKVEACLYLDAYPENARAIEFYKSICRELDYATELYERKYGPLTIGGATHTSADSWSWTRGPWPWQYEWEGN